MDVVAILLAITFFAAMLALVEGLDRVWGPPTSPACSSSSRCWPTWPGRCCAGRTC